MMFKQLSLLAIVAVAGTGLVACLPAKTGSDASLKADEAAAAQAWSRPLTDEETRITQQFKPANYTIDLADAFDAKDVAQHQLQSPDTPENLKGVWWMDGNPLADRTVSFRNLKFDDINGKKRGYFAVFADNNYSYTANPEGMNLAHGGSTTVLVYKVEFNKEFTEGSIIPTVKAGLLGVSIPSTLVDFRIKLLEDGLYLRESFFLGRSINTYNFRRIIDKEGQVVRHQDNRWENFLKASAMGLVLPKRK